MPSPFFVCVDVPALSAADARLLLGIARNAVRGAVGIEPPPPLPSDLPPRLRTPAGAFVSLHRGDHLRGCIGRLTASEPLGRLVARMAAAVTHDPRFPPLGLQELAGLWLEISVLSRTRALPPDRLDPDRHGVVLRLGEARAVLLPQVARRHGWDRARLLAEICSKAGVSSTAWRRADAVLRAFTVATVEGPAVEPS